MDQESLWYPEKQHDVTENFVFPRFCATPWWHPNKVGRQCHQPAAQAVLGNQGETWQKATSITRGMWKMLPPPHLKTQCNCHSISPAPFWGHEIPLCKYFHYSLSCCNEESYQLCGSPHYCPTKPGVKAWTLYYLFHCLKIVLTPSYLNTYVTRKVLFYFGAKQT